MTTHLYTTSLDGMRTIMTEQPVKDNDYVFIKDDLYVDDVTLFKNKKTNNDQVDLKIVKLAEITFLNEEEQQKFKNNQLYIFNDKIFTSNNRLNKNQLLQIDDKYYLVENIIKNIEGPQGLELSEIPYISAINFYTILQTNEETYETKVYNRYPSYREAIGALWRLRESRDGNFYRFP